MSVQPQRVERIRALLSHALQPSRLEVLDESATHAGHAGHGGRGHYRVRIATSRFQGMDRLARHRLVNDTLAPLFATDIHALALECLDE